MSSEEVFHYGFADHAAYQNPCAAPNGVYGKSTNIEQYIQDCKD